MDSPAPGVLGLAMAQPITISDAPVSSNEQRALCWSRVGFGAAAGEGVKEEEGSSVGRRRAERMGTGWRSAMGVGRKGRKVLAPGSS